MRRWVCARSSTPGYFFKAKEKKNEKEIKQQLDSLQFLNEDIVDLTIMYEAMLHRLCEITGVEIPSVEDTPPEDELH